MQYLNKNKQQLLYAIIQRLLKMHSRELRSVLVFIWQMDRKGAE